MSKPEKEPVWLPLTHVVKLWGVTRQTFHDQVRPLLPADAVRGAGRRGVLIHVPRAIAAVIQAKVAEATAGDPLLAAGTDSPQLERYRAARADLAEMERDTLRGELVRREWIGPALDRMSGMLRGVGHELAKRYGNDAAELINEAADEWAAGVVRLSQQAETEGQRHRRQQR